MRMEADDGLRQELQVEAVMVPGAAAASSDVTRAASEPFFEFRCSDCGYGARCRMAPERCPMCGHGAWEYVHRLDLRAHLD
jgi:rubrerythrin